MDAARWKQIDDLLDEALDVSAEMRVDFVTARAGDDYELRGQVLELLRAQTDAGQFLKDPAVEVAARTIAEDQPVVSAFAYLNKRIANYHVERLLGNGGMGEVYLAFDEKMRRKVALKILPAVFTSDDERVKRFELEAQAISSINHPGIVTIYDVGNFEGVNYIATEFVDGKTLRDLIGGKFKLRNIVLNAIQICDALSAAHAEGIIHRDIKPENIMIRKDGYAKILDFGLAKLVGSEPGANDDVTVTSKGMVIGTPAYMSPAQATSDAVDQRTDLWSCGVVLYEFLTGKNPFKKANRQETFQSILSDEPPPCSSLNPEIPESLDRILTKLLEKNPAMGYQTASDLRADFKRVEREISSSPSGSADVHPIADTGQMSLKQRRFWLGTVTLAAAALLLGTYFILFRTPSQPVSEWASARNVQLTFQSGTEAYPSISPDGKSFIFAAGPSGNLDIFLQRIGGTNARNLTEDSKSDDIMPVFSPDGENIAFRSEREPKGIYVMGATGENPKRIADFGYSPAWSPNGKELALATSHQDIPSVRGRSSLWIVNIEDGSKRRLIDGFALQPSWSPDGKRIAYWDTENGGKRVVATIAAGGGDPAVFADTSNTNWNPVWSPDGKYLYYASDRGGNMAFWRARIDPETGRAVGEHEIVPTPAKFNRHLAFSHDGKRLVYVQTTNQSNIKSASFDAEKEKLKGEPVWVTNGDFEFSAPELSPDGMRFLSRLVRKTQDDIVSLNVDGSGMRDLTNDPHFDRYARWSPDGKRVAFASDRSGNYEIWIMDADGTNLRQVTNGRTTPLSFPLWSPDGKRMTYDSGTRVYLIDVDKPWSAETAQPLPLGENGGFFRMWDWSSDGSKLAGFYDAAAGRGIGYYSFETKKYVRLTDYNAIPRWLPDSRRLITEHDGKVTIIDTETGKVRNILPEIKDQIRNIALSRDGKLLYYTTMQSESDIWLLDLTSEK